MTLTHEASIHSPGNTSQNELLFVHDTTALLTHERCGVRTGLRARDMSGADNKQRDRPGSAQVLKLERHERKSVQRCAP